MPLPVRPKRRSSTLRSRGRRFSIRNAERFLPLVVLLHDEGAGVRHRLGQLEVAVVVEDGVEADRGAGGGLEVGQVFEAAAGAVGQFLRAGQVLAAVGQGFALLLEQAEFLKMVRAKADQVACRATAICSVWRIHQVA